MSSNESKGICRFCYKSFSGKTMGRHLTSCKSKMEKDAKSAANKKEKVLIYHIKISGYKVYWLHIEIKAAKKLTDLDKFLRNIWCECCGHLSEFKINDESYLYPVPGETNVFSDMFGRPEKSMKTPLYKVLSKDDTFRYDYDFGSTTQLEGKVIAVRKGYLKEPVRILARNDPFEFSCEKCGKSATLLCIDCGEFYCEKCLPEHECGEDMEMPVVNSPRMGECGYTGVYDLDDFSVPDEKKP